MKARLLGILLFAIILVLAGCSTDPDVTQNTEADLTDKGNVTPDQSEDPLRNEETPAQPENPWGKEQVVVGISRESDVRPNESIQDAVQEAIEYWRDSDAGWYDVNFTLRPESESPDLNVRATRMVKKCGDQTTNTTYAFCADVLEQGSRVSESAEISISTAFTPNTTAQAVKHSFGYLFGITDAENETDLQPIVYRYEDPWPSQDAVSVNLSVVDGRSDRNWSGMVREGIQYWQYNDDRYGNYTKEMVFKPSAAHADITVEIVSNITECGVESGNFIGCADYYNRSIFADDDSSVRIESGYSRETTVNTVKHEFGHIYGRPHNKPPMPLMNETDADATLLPRPNATAREWPWDQQSVQIYVDYSSFDADQDEIESQARYAVEYYDNGADGYIPENKGIQLTDDRSEAEIVVRSGPLNDCTGSSGDGSCGFKHGVSSDSDPALEYYTSQTINISGIAAERTGWHIGYWLGSAFVNPDDSSDLPPPFDKPRTDSRERWW